MTVPTRVNQITVSINFIRFTFQQLLVKASWGQQSPILSNLWAVWKNYTFPPFWVGFQEKQHFKCTVFMKSLQGRAQAKPVSLDLGPSLSFLDFPFLTFLSFILFNFADFLYNDPKQQAYLWSPGIFPRWKKWDKRQRLRKEERGKSFLKHWACPPLPHPSILSIFLIMANQTPGILISNGRILKGKLKFNNGLHWKE